MKIPVVSILLGTTLIACSGNSDHSAATTPGPASTGPTNSVGSTTSAQTSIGPIPLDAGEEKTVCIVTQLDNANPMVISSLEADLAPGSHHLIVSKADSQDVELTPTPCATFSSILNGETKPLLIVNTPHGSLTFPDGVALELVAHQKLRLEGHYLNDTTTAVQGQGTVTFNGVDASKAGTYQAADTYIWGTTKISIPANSTFTTPVVFQAGVAGTNLMSITTHEHRLGTEVLAWTSSSASDKGTQVADDKNWSEPNWTTFQSPMSMNGTNGLSFQCSWNNTTTGTVAFGESAVDEMCFLIGFYYPSHGLDLCVDNHCLERGDAGTP